MEEVSLATVCRGSQKREEQKVVKRGKGNGGVYQPYHINKQGEKVVSDLWWIYFSHNGVQHKENSNSKFKTDAWDLLKKRLGEIGEGKPTGPKLSRTMFEDLAGLIVNDYKANKKASLNRLEDALTHLRGFFCGYKARDITSARVTAYIAYRLGEGQKAAPSTINKELSALGRMFTLGMIDGIVATKPHISKLQENNVRKGFFDPDQFQAVLKHLPEDLQALAVTAYVTGWRVPSEVQTRQRHHLNLKDGWLRLDPGETKNGEGRNFPLTPMLKSALERQVARTEALQKASGRIIPWLFHRDGKQIKTFYKSWKTACKKAGLPGMICHDFRRTAVMNLEAAGVSRSAAMAMVGHKTQSIYGRYAIVDHKALKDAAAKLAQLQSEVVEKAQRDKLKEALINGKIIEEPVATDVICDLEISPSINGLETDCHVA